MIDKNRLQDDLAPVLDKHQVDGAVLVYRDGTTLSLVASANNEVDFAGCKALTDWLLENLPAVKGPVTRAMEDAVKKLENPPGN